MSNERELLKAFFDPANPTEVAQVLGGLFFHVLMLEWSLQSKAFDAAAIKNNLSVPKNEKGLDEAALEAAFDSVAKSFMEPIRSKLLAQRADFMAAVHNRS